MATIKFTGDKEKLGRLVIRYKNILLIILVIWMFSFAFYRNNAPVNTLDTNRSWGQDVCGYPLPHSYQTPYGCIISSIHHPEIPPRGVSYKLCDFFTENFYPASCEVEFLTVEAVRRVIQPSDSVLEIGSRYGSTTCEVAVRQMNSGRVVAVEPDHTVWAAAEFNKMSHNCAGWSVLGVVGEGEDLTMDYIREEEDGDNEQHRYNGGYNFRPSDRKEKSKENTVTVKHFTWNEIEEVTGITFNTLILDCEGCHRDFINTHRHQLSNIYKILFEVDGSTEEIDESLATLQTLGFKVNKAMTRGKRKWLGSLMVLTKGEDEESETENRAGEDEEKGVLVENNGSDDHLPENLAKYYERFLH